jgi:predicted dehydrogenase
VSNGVEKTQPATRRAFLGAAAMTAASYQRILGANDRVGIGLIGYGLIGKQHIGDLKKFKDVDILGVCDCYKPRVEEALAFIGDKRTVGYSDFRKMYENKNIQGVIIATPDHWHALLTIMACAAGKDVYVEKPMTLFIDEGKWMIQAARKYNRIVVVGTQRRQGTGVKEAKKLIQSGLLGKIHSIRMGFYRNIYPGFGKTPVENPPADFNYDMWLGPAPKKPYQRHRGIYHFRWFWDYSGGQMTNLGAHLIDQILWIMEAKGPTLAMSTGGRYALEDDGETPDLQDAMWVFPGQKGQPGFVLNCAIREANAMADTAGRGQVYLGTKGNLVLAGSFQVTSEMRWINPENEIPKFLGHPAGGPRYDGTGREPFLPQYAEPQAGRGGRGAAAGGVASDARYGTGGEDTLAMNKRDWIDCMRSRKRPFCEVEDGHRVSIVMHLANMSLKLGRAIRWDPDKETVIGDTEAQAMCSKPYRAPWDKELRAIVKV